MLRKQKQRTKSTNRALETMCRGHSEKHGRSVGPLLPMSSRAINMSLTEPTLRAQDRVPKPYGDFILTHMTEDALGPPRHDWGLCWPLTYYQLALGSAL